MRIEGDYWSFLRLIAYLDPNKNKQSKYNSYNKLESINELKVPCTSPYDFIQFK